MMTQTKTLAETALVVEMPYIPNLTDNHRLSQNGFRRYLKPEVKEWQGDLAMLVRNQVVLAGLEFAADQRFKICVSYAMLRRHRYDVGNQHKSLGDGIKAGLDVDDRYFFFEDDPDVKLVDDVRDAGFVIRIIPLAEDGYDAGMGSDR